MRVPACGPRTNRAAIGIVIAAVALALGGCHAPWAHSSNTAGGTLTVVLRSSVTTSEVAAVERVLASDRDVARVRYVSPEENSKRFYSMLASNGIDQSLLSGELLSPSIDVWLSRPLDPAVMKRVHLILDRDPAAARAVDTSVGMDHGLTNPLP